MASASPNPGSVPNSRMPAEDRRRQLIDTSIDLFSRKGFAGTTTREIAAAAGVNEAIIFRHFATKQDLYKAILDSMCADKSVWMDELNAMMDANDDEGLVRAVIRGIVSHSRENPRFQRLMLHAALEGHEIAIIHHNQVKMPIGNKLIEYIARRQAAGAIRQFDPRTVIIALAGIPQFYAFQKYVYQSPEFQDSDDEIIESFVRIVSGGLLAPQSSQSTDNPNAGKSPYISQPQHTPSEETRQ